MTRSHDIHGESEAFGDVSPSPSGPPSGRSAVILSFPALPSAAASEWAGGEETDDTWLPVGLLAVRLVGRFQRPRILVWSAPESGDEEHPPGL